MEIEIGFFGRFLIGFFRYLRSPFVYRERSRPYLSFQKQIKI